MRCEFIIITRLNKNIQMLRIFKQIGMSMSLKKTLKLKTAQFLSVEAGAVIRNMPTSKQRKYKNVEVTEDFKKLDQKRKKQRYENVKKRQILLQQKLKNQAQLLTGPQTQLIKTQMQALQKIIQDSTKEIQQLTQVIESTEAQYLVAEGPLKVGIINHIKYLQYLQTHEAGHTLHPETIKAIENVHYCVNHNLPINRITLYEIMPEYFEEEIGELEESVRRLIEQKQIFIEDQEARSSVRFFEKVDLAGNVTQAQMIVDQLQQAFYNMTDHCIKLMDVHHDLLQKVAHGKTPFRNLQHLSTVLLSDMPIKYLPEEQALRQDLLYVKDLVKQWQNYRKVRQEEIKEVSHRYIEPPIYIKRHPVLSKRYEQIMKVFMNPIPLTESPLLTTGDQTQVIFAKNLEEQIRTIVQQKYDPIFIQAMNSDRSKLDKKKLEIQFYNLSTNIMENLLALEDKSSEQQQFIQALPKEKGLLTKQNKKNLISKDHLTRIIYLNKLDKNKYNVAFFAKWFGVDKDELAAALQYVSYLRVPMKISEDKVLQSQVKIDVLKFQF